MNIHEQLMDYARSWPGFVSAEPVSLRVKRTVWPAVFYTVKREPPKGSHSLNAYEQSGLYILGELYYLHRNHARYVLEGRSYFLAAHMSAKRLTAEFAEFYKLGPSWMLSLDTYNLVVDSTHVIYVEVTRYVVKD